MVELGTVIYDMSYEPHSFYFDWNSLGCENTPLSVNLWIKVIFHVNRIKSQQKLSFTPIKYRFVSFCLSDHTLVTFLYVSYTHPHVSFSTFWIIPQVLSLFRTFIVQFDYKLLIFSFHH